MYVKYKFLTRGIGIVSTELILKNTYVGDYFSKNQKVTTESRYIYDGWVETNPLGRFLNHSNEPNCTLLLKEDIIEIYTNSDINKWSELTVNYSDIIKLINLPNNLIKQYNILNFSYILEEVIINKSLI